MKELYPILSTLDYFTTKQVVALGYSYNTAMIWLGREVNKGLIERISKGYYVTKSRKDELIRSNKRGHRVHMIGSQILDQGAILSYETVLSLYQVIPEMVTASTFATSHTTKQITTPWGRYHYRKITKRFWRGYETKIIDNMMYYIATPEKALFDWLWWVDDVVWQESRFTELRLEFDMLDYDRFADYVSRSKSAKMKKVLFFLTKIRGL